MTLEEIDGELLAVDCTIGDDYSSLEEEGADTENKLQRAEVSTCFAFIKSVTFEGGNNA